MKPSLHGKAPFYSFGGFFISSTKGRFGVEWAHMEEENKKTEAEAEAEKKAALDELAILKQNQAAAAKGPVTGTVGKAEPEKPEAEDPFLKGFNLGI